MIEIRITNNKIEKTFIIKPNEYKHDKEEGIKAILHFCLENEIELEKESYKDFELLCGHCHKPL